jgi:hypothetical protein
MAQIVKLRRSSVSGQKPTNSNLQLGELALNTTDGKVYMAKSGSLGPSVEELITTNTVNTGSINISGSIDLIGTETISGSLQISGSGFLNSRRILTDLDTGSMGLINSIQFNTSSNISVKPGELAWNNTDGTLDLGMKGGNVVQQIGQEIFYEVRNETGIQIPNGTAVYANGVTVGSGRITVAPYTADGSIRENRFLGIATENITSGINGFVTHFGYVRGLDTRGTTVSSIAVGDETWAVGDILYVHPTVAGKLTKVKPQHEITVAIIINRHQSAGILFVRPSSGGHLEDVHDILINTGSLTNGQVLMYNNTNGLWENNNNFTGSFIGDGSEIYNLPYSGLTNVPTLVSGSSQISYTGITDIPLGIVSGSSQIIDLGFTTTSSFNSFASGALLSSQTSSMTVLSSSYAVTASYALNGGGGGTEGRTSKLEQTVVSDTWTFAHNLGEKYPAIEVFDENDYVIIPTNILAVDENNLTITFSHEITGVATATVGGGLPYISGSYNGRVLAVGAGNPVWKEGIISGSLQVSNFGFATTGSNAFKNNQIITGSVVIRNAKMDATCVTLTSSATIFSLSDYNGAIFDYVVKNGGNMRAGTITGVWTGAVSSYNETSTVDLGTTSNINFNISGTGQLNAVISGGTWQVEVFYRALGCVNGEATSTNYLISTGYTVSEPCNGLFGSDQTVYGNASDWLETTRFYTNSGMTTPFNGNSLYYGDSVASYGTTLQIDSSGYVINSYAC